MADDYGLLGGLGQGLQAFTKVYGEAQDRNLRIAQMQAEIDERKRLRERQGLLDAQAIKQQKAENLSKGLMETPEGELTLSPDEQKKRSLEMGLLGAKAEKEKADAKRALSDAANPRPRTDMELRNASDLRKEFQGRPGVKDFNQIQTAYRKVESAANEPSAAGDLSLIYGYMKMLDPNSTVREGEFASAQNAAGVPDKIRNMANKIISGERLNVDQRKDFISQARNVYRAQAEQMKAIEDEFGGLSKRYGVDPGLIYSPQTNGLIVPQDNIKEIGGKKYKKVQGGWQEL